MNLLLISRRRLLTTLLTTAAMLPLITQAQLINNGTQIVAVGATYIVLDNLSMQNNGTFNQNAGTVSFTGNANATISGTGSTAFYNLTLNKPSATLQLQRAVDLANRLEFTNGLLELNARTLRMAPTAVLAGESELSRITGTSGGYVEITVGLNAPVGANPGQLGIEISSTQNLGSVIVRRGHQSHTNLAGNGSSIFRYFEVIPSINTGLNASLRFHYLDAELNGLNENMLTVWKRNGSTWTDLGRTGNDAGINFVEESPINDFTRFTLSVPANTLPLQWSSFNTQCLTGKVSISWKTAQEINTSRFVIRRSADAGSWTDMKTIPAAGSSNAVINYAWTDPQPLTGTSYYQVQQFDIDGRMTVSPILLNQCDAEDGLKVFPNPMGSEGWATVQSASGGQIMLSLYDVKGRLMQQRRETIIPGTNQLRLSMARYTAGMYSLVVVWPDGQARVAMIKKQ